MQFFPQALTPGSHPLLVVNPPFMILFYHHFYPSLPVAALQYNCLEFKIHSQRFNELMYGIL